VKLKRCQNRGVCAGQVGRTGLIFGVQSTCYDSRGGYGADKNRTSNAVDTGLGDFVDDPSAPEDVIRFEGLHAELG
jgi:hypothetical protein